MRKYGKIVGDWIARVGVPTAIAFALLWVQVTKLDRLIEKIDHLTVVVQAQKGGGE